MDAPIEATPDAQPAEANMLTGVKDARLCVLASGSSGNCSVLLMKEGPRPRVVLIDAGLAPKRIARLLRERGLAMHHVTDIVLTHLDLDHCHARALAHRDLRARVHVHTNHVRRAMKNGLRENRIVPFTAELNLSNHLRADVELLSHDELGVACFRFEIETGGRRASLGFATDLGRATEPLLALLAGVDVLAIESNYCRGMQLESDRPAFLKSRIMNGSGHLSNDECAEAVQRIAPREHVVFLHLSRQCNHPDRVAQLHAGADYGYTISSQVDPTRWVPIRSGFPGARSRPLPEVLTTPAPVQPSLFGRRA